MLRAVIGGTGNVPGTSGEVIETPLGVKPTNLFNVGFVFSLAKQAPQ